MTAGSLARALLRFPLITLQGHRAHLLAGAEAAGEARAVSRPSRQARDPTKLRNMNTRSPLLLEVSICRARPRTIAARAARPQAAARASSRSSSTANCGSSSPTAEQHVFGRRHAGFDLGCTLYFDHPQSFADAAFGGTVGAGEAYIRGLWRCDDLTALVRILVANREQMNAHGLAAGRSSAVRCCACCTGPTATAGTAARATSPRTTTSATISTSSCSTRRWPIPARIFPRDGRDAAGGVDREVRSRLPQAGAQAHRSPGRDRHGLGRVRHPRRAALRLPRHHHDDLRRAARLREEEDRRARPVGPHHACCSRTIAISTGPVRQARLHRDDRGRRRAVPRRLFPPLLAAAQARRRDAAAGHHAAGPVLRAGAEVGRLHPALRVPGQLHSLGRRRSSNRWRRPPT